MATMTVILPAAGKSTRFGHLFYKKPFAPLRGRAVWLHAASTFQDRRDVRQTILVVASEDREEFQEKHGGTAALMGIEVVDGGGERVDSVANALARVREDVDLVAIHDAARPLVTNQLIDEVKAAALEHGAAIAALPVRDTLKRADAEDRERIAETVDRQRLWQAQTPQIFRREWLIEAYAGRGEFQPTDDAQLVERLGRPVRLIEGSALNFKITSQEDLKLAERLGEAARPHVPTHPFADDRFR